MNDLVRPAGRFIPDKLEDKVKTTRELVPLLEAIRADGSRIVFTNGCFDLIHRGHVELLLQARKMGTHLVVGLNSDASIGRIKGPGRPVQNQSDRAAILAGMVMVDFVVIFDEDDPGRLIEAVKPDVLVKGGDWRPDEVVGRETVEARGGKVVIVPYLAGKSTSSLISRIRSNELLPGESDC